MAPNRNENDPIDEVGEDEPSGGVLDAGSELEEALRAAEEAIDARGAPAMSTDKRTIEALATELRELREEHENVLKDRDEHKDRHLRLQAEFENFRRRNLKERQEALQYGHQNLVKDLLATVDNLDRAIEHTEESASTELQALLQGVELVRRELLGALAKHGVNPIEAQGKTFDPALHEAMSQVDDDSVPNATVVQVLQKGYQLRDRMLRPARVIVSRSQTAASAPQESAEPSTDPEGEGRP